MKTRTQFFRLLWLELRTMPYLWLFATVLIALHVSSLYIRYWFGMDMDLWLSNHESGFEDMYTMLAIVYAATYLFPSMTPNSLEFMFTRAADRKSYFSAKSMVFLFLVLIPIFVHILYAITEPNMVLASRSSEMSERGQIFLSHFKDVRTEPGDGEFHQRLIVPGGRMVYAEWKLWSCSLLALVTLGWTTGIRRCLPRISTLSWTLPLVMIAPYLLLLFVGNELFSLYLSSTRITIAAILLVGFGLYKFCEREFVRMQIA